MSYDPNELTPRDVIRGMAGDTSTDELIPDSTYDSILSRYGVPATGWNSSSAFLRAGAEALRRVAIAIEQDVTSFTATGDMSVGWGDKTRSLRKLADELDSQADDIDEDDGVGAYGLTRIKNNFLAGSEGGYEW